MRFEGLTQSVQSKYNLSYSFLSGTCEYEEWDGPEKLSHILYSATPLIGEALISDEQKNDFSTQGIRLFKKLMNHGEDSLSSFEKRILIAAIIFLVQQMDDSKDADKSDDQLWEYIFSKLELDEKKYSQQTARNKLTPIILSTARVSTDHGKQYYNTLKMQALAPANSICELFEIIYKFYRTNLDCQYEDSDNAFVLLSNYLQRKLKSGENAEQIKLGSSVWALKSSIKVLFIYHPEYMAAVCDAITKKLDMLLRGDNPYLCECNRWDVLLKKWFTEKSAAEKASMKQIRAKRINSQIVTSKEKISPEYILKETSLLIRVPRIRLQEITQRPIIRIFQGENAIFEGKLSGYGDEICYTTHEYSADLSLTNNVDWSSPLYFRIQISCVNNVIYDSNTHLYRDYLIFNEEGLESTLNYCRDSFATIVANTSANIRIDDPEDEYYEETIDFQQIRIALFSTQSIIINGEDILRLDDKKQAIRFYLPDYVKGVHGEYCSKEVLFFDRKPVLHIALDKNESSKNYQIVRDNSIHSLYEYSGEADSFSVALPAANNIPHHISIKEFHTGKIIYECNYFVFQGFSFGFSKPYFFNEECNGQLWYILNGSKKTVNFLLEENQRFIKIDIWNGKISLEFDVPKIELTINGENILNWPEHIWHKDISQDQFIKVAAPDNVNISFLLGAKSVPKTKRRSYYELGNMLFANAWGKEIIAFGIIINYNNSREERKIADVHFVPKFLSSPIQREGIVLKWSPWHDEPSNNFVGPENPTYKVELENDKDDPYFYSDLRLGKPFESNFDFKPGKYECKVFCIERSNNPFKKDCRSLAWLETITIEQKPELRFDSKDIFLSKAHFWSVETGKNEIAEIRRNNAVITEIQYAGLNDMDGDLEYPVHTYSGNIMFQTSSGKWHYMNYNPESKEFELINPITFYVNESGLIVIYNANGEQVQLNSSKYLSNGQVRILNRKEEMTTAEQRKWLPIADEFDFWEE